MVAHGGVLTEGAERDERFERELIVLKERRVDVGDAAPDPAYLDAQLGRSDDGRVHEVRRHRSGVQVRAPLRAGCGESAVRDDALDVAAVRVAHDRIDRRQFDGETTVANGL